MNGDSLGDVALLSADGQVQVFPGRGDGTFDAPLSTPAPGFHGDPVWFDVDGDGWLDLAYGSGATLRVMRGLSDGTFGPPIDSPMPARIAYNLMFGDLDGDGIADAAFSGGYLWVAHGLGGGRFDPSASRPVADASIPVLIEDLDGDGRLDLAAWHDEGWPCHLRCASLITLLQGPDGTLGPANVNLMRGPWGGLLEVRDVDGDSVRDVCFWTEVGIVIARGLGGGRFMEAVGVLPGVGYQPIVAADLDLDGRTDAIAVSQDRVSILWGRDPEPPTVALLAPQAGAPLVPGTQVALRWAASDDVAVASIDLFLSRHGRSGPFTPIARGLSNSGLYTWSVSGPVSDSVAFKVVARDAAGNVAHDVSPALFAIAGSLAVDTPALPARLAIAAVSPNPARGRFTVRLALPRAGHVALALHDLQGRRVATLFDGPHDAGLASLDWALADAAPGLRPGLYFLRLSDGRERAVARLVLTR